MEYWSFATGSIHHFAHHIGYDSSESELVRENILHSNFQSFKNGFQFMQGKPVLSALDAV
jgi:hypothetical protein